MARQKRAKSETGIYHIILRGNNKQIVFYDKEDYYLFLNILSTCKTLCGFKLYAYCLMDNHIHLLIQEGNEPLDLIFKRIGNRFVYWYNLKYDRCGGIFQGRYKSIPVNDDEYFITVLRYIHQNPVKAGIVEKCSDYEFSSYNSYFKWASFVDTEFPLGLISQGEFEKVHLSVVDDIAIEGNNNRRVSNYEAQRIVEACNKTNTFNSMPVEMQKAYIGQLKDKGLSIRQICSLTGAPKRFVENQKQTDF